VDNLRFAIERLALPSVLCSTEPEGNDVSEESDTVRWGRVGGLVPAEAVSGRGSSDRLVDSLASLELVPKSTGVILVGLREVWIPAKDALAEREMERAASVSLLDVGEEEEVLPVGLLVLTLLLLLSNIGIEPRVVDDLCTLILRPVRARFGACVSGAASAGGELAVFFREAGFAATTDVMGLANMSSTRWPSDARRNASPRNQSCCSS